MADDARGYSKSFVLHIITMGLLHYNHITLGISEWARNIRGSLLHGTLPFDNLMPPIG